MATNLTFLDDSLPNGCPRSFLQLTKGEGCRSGDDADLKCPLNRRGSRFALLAVLRIGHRTFIRGIAHCGIGIAGQQLLGASAVLMECITSAGSGSRSAGHGLGLLGWLRSSKLIEGSSRDTVPPLPILRRFRNTEYRTMATVCFPSFDSRQGENG